MHGPYRPGMPKSFVSVARFAQDRLQPRQHCKALYLRSTEGAESVAFHALTRRSRVSALRGIWGLCPARINYEKRGNLGISGQIW
jgi:hypothetical protein